MKTPLVTSDVVYIGGIYEKDTISGVVTKYYFADGRRIAMRDNGTLYYLAGDHVGSTSLVMTSTGSVYSRSWYTPYGNLRVPGGQSWPTPPTDKLFTGQQRELVNNTIYHYGARLYDPNIGKFISADPIRPSSGDPQALNRYSYVMNNPVNYNDPTGMYLVDAAGEPINESPVCYSCGGPPIHTVPTYEEQLAKGLAPLLPILGVSIWEPSPAEEIVIAGVAVGYAGYITCQFYCGSAIESAGDVIGSIGTLFAGGGAKAPELPDLDETGVPPEGWEWRGTGPEGSSQGSWVPKNNPKGGEYIRPDFSHGDEGFHYDGRDQNGNEGRFTPGKGWEPK